MCSSGSDVATLWHRARTVLDYRSGQGDGGSPTCANVHSRTGVDLPGAGALSTDAISAPSAPSSFLVRSCANIAAATSCRRERPCVGSAACACLPSGSVANIRLGATSPSTLRAGTAGCALGLSPTGALPPCTHGRAGAGPLCSGRSLSPARRTANWVGTTASSRCRRRRSLPSASTCARDVMGLPPSSWRAWPLLRTLSLTILTVMWLLCTCTRLPALLLLP